MSAVFIPLGSTALRVEAGLDCLPDVVGDDSQYRHFNPHPFRLWTHPHDALARLGVKNLARPSPRPVACHLNRFSSGARNR